MKPCTLFISVRIFSITLLFPAVLIGMATALGQNLYENRIPEDAGRLAQQYLSGNGQPNGLAKTPAILKRFFTGAVAGDYFGYTVSSAGDVNGDGYDDVIVGAHLNDAGGTNAGRAFLFFGGLTIDNTVDVVLTGAAADDLFGFPVSSAGDVNGDGYSDVIVGASQAGGTGRAYIYFGGSAMDTTADVILAGVAASDNFGVSVSAAGDVNGDGYGDVVVGAYWNDAGGANAGQAYAYFGGAAMDSTADVVFTGAAAGDSFGHSVSSAGDVNGDGYGDVIIGAYGNDAGGTDAGQAYVYFGGLGMDSNADVILTGTAAGDYFGYHTISSAGDVNGDGYGDVIVGAYGNDAGGTDAGQAYVYFGGPVIDASADVILTGVEAGDVFGVSVSSAGDVNGDGYSDVIVGASANDGGGTDAGRAYVYFGGSAMDNTADMVFTGAEAGDAFGFSVSSAGDVNGDGYSDMIIGAYKNSAGGFWAGRAYVYMNSLTGTDLPDEFFTGASAGNAFGFSVSSAGDVNGDGYDDMIVGALGRASVYFGGSAMDTTADIVLAGVTADYFGLSVSTAGDVNGDGYGDVIVGASRADMAVDTAGRAYVYFGGSAMDSTADMILAGSAALDDFGSSVSSAGDVNGDGYGDVIVGARRNDFGGTDAGQAYVYFGGSTMDTTADVILTAYIAGDWFGGSVSSAGDVNGDGYGDVIVGAKFNDDMGTNAGQAYVYLGGASMDNVPDIILTGAATGDVFGSSVSTAGDVNGDGYGDVIVGAEFNSAGGFSAGRAYVYFGGAVMEVTNMTADVILTGSERESFGNSVSSAGDVNGDGYGDVIVGAPQINASVAATGRAYVYFGGSSMDATADVMMSGEVGDEFGSSVSTASDVNGDGYSDVIVGSDLNDAGGTDAGRAYLYLSSSPPIVPRITTVKDVPFDQGGKMELKWIRSAYDVRGISGITAYVVERSGPAGASGFFWEQIASITPRHNPRYASTVSMPYDSMSGTSGAFFFRITAQTSNPNEYWRSNIVSGYSVDNLAPLSPGGSNIAPLTGGPIQLTWSPNRTDPDMAHYAAYRSISSGFTVSPATRIGTTTDTVYVDSTSTIGLTYYYRITSVDVHGNESVPTDELSVVSLPVQVKVPLEGPKEFTLHQNFPNPFNPQTRIEYDVPKTVHVSVKLYDPLGRLVRTLVDEQKNAGYYHTVLNARDLPSGVYYYRIVAGDFVKVRKLVLIR